MSEYPCDQARWSPTLRSSSGVAQARAWLGARADREDSATKSGPSGFVTAGFTSSRLSGRGSSAGAWELVIYVARLKRMVRGHACPLDESRDKHLTQTPSSLPFSPPGFQILAHSLLS